MLIFTPINLLVAIFCLLSSVDTIGSILVSISLSQMSRFLIGMDTFAATKCQIGTKSDVNDDQIKQCISGMNVVNLGTIFNLSLEKGHPEKKLLSHQSSISGPSTSTRQLASSEMTPMSSAQLTPSHSFDSPISEQLTPMRSLGSSISAKLTPMHSFDASMSAQLAPSHSFDTAADLIGHNHSFDQMDRKKAGKSLINDKKQKHIELEADQFVAFMLKKMLKKVPVEFKERLKIFKKQKRNRTLAEELSNLTSKQNLLMLLELQFITRRSIDKFGHKWKGFFSLH
ncbi:hypothetical protein niasHS_015152 [Heterodera schachtii]|uniref:Uncharacterized protein n=1 Tax=Heterodera schachtii TaxID=97005 RepID=A0ABD2I5I5_HETSC